MSKAWGLVTSWIRWSPMNSCVWPFGSVRTVCRSQTFLKRVEGMGNGTTRVGTRGPGPALGARRSALHALGPDLATGNGVPPQTPATAGMHCSNCALAGGDEGRFCDG